MDPEVLAALLARLDDAANPLTDEELASIEAELVAVASEVDPSNPSHEDIAVLTETAANLDAVRTVQTQRAEETAERAAQAAELLRAIAPPADEAASTDEAAAEVAEGEQAAEAAEGTDVVAEAEQVVAEEAAPVAAAAILESTMEVIPSVNAPAPAAAPAFVRPSISHLARRRPAERRPVRAAVDHEPGRAVLTASSDIPNIPAGASLEPEQWAEGVVRKFDSVRRSTLPGQEKIYLGQIRRDWPVERWLDDNENANEDKINAILTPDRLLEPTLASGGICGPVGVDFNISTIATAERPFRDSLVQFGANRGGLRYILPHTLAQVTADGPASVWTASNDVSLNSPSTKPHATFACQGVQESTVDAIVSIVQFGNFQARYFVEQITQYMETAEAVHSRLAESTLLAAAFNGSTAVNAGAYDMGAAREVLDIVGRALEGLRYRHRAFAARFDVAIPHHLREMIRTDLAKNMPGDSGGQSERLAVADREIDAWFAVRGANLTTYIDNPTGASVLQGFLPQGAGQLTPWPLKTIIGIWPTGSWMFLDGGELNLGMVRDSTLNRTNDFQMFSETFEKVIFRGHESLAITCNIAPTGASVGTEAPVSVTPTLGS